MSARQQHALAELRAALVCDAGRVAETLLGKPNLRLSSRRTLRFGSNGSVAVEIWGAKAGLYFNHEDGEGGDLLDLVQRTLRLTFGEAVAWAEAASGTTSSAARVAISPASLQRELAEREAGRQATAEPEDAEAIAKAQRIWAEAVPIAPGSPGDRYLKVARGIPRPAPCWPDVVRWHPVRSALVFAATTPDGTVAAAQRIYVTPNGQKLSQAELIRRGLPKAKLTSGRPSHGAVVRLPGSRPGPLLLVEGPEDGLIAWTATGCETWITLGFMGADSVGRQLPDDRPTVVIRDGDATGSPAAKALDAAIVRWREAGHDVREAYGRDDRAAGKYDLNDLLRDQGMDAVRARIDAAIWLGAPPPKRIAAREVASVLEPAIAAFVRRNLGFDADLPEWAEPEAALFRVDPGGRKSHTAAEVSVRALATRNAPRRVGRGPAIIFSLPRQRLATEFAATVSQLAEPYGLKVAVKLGMEQPDPMAPGETMCRALDRIKDARSVLAPVESSACRKRLPDGTIAVCPFFDVCGAQRQRAELKAADIAIVQHADLQQDRPSYLGKNGIVFVDETPVNAFVSDRARRVNLDLLGIKLEVPGASDGESAEVVGYLHRLRDALASIDGQAVSRGFIESSGLTAADLLWTRSRVRSCFRDPGLHPALGREEWRRRVTESSNSDIAKLAAVLKAFADLLDDHDTSESGRIWLDWEQHQDGQIRVLRLLERHDLGKGWRIPTGRLDATPMLDVERAIWPSLTVAVDIHVAAPHMRVIRMTGKTWAHSQIVPGSSRHPISKKDAQTRANNRADLRVMLTNLARRYAPGKVLAVVPLAVERLFLTEAGWPANLIFAHHGGLDGSNAYDDVRAIILVGRLEPSPRSAERFSGGWTGRSAASLEDWYPSVTAAQEMAAGYGCLVGTSRHPDPTAEAFRHRAAVGGIVQTAHRGRGIWRTADNPLDVILANDVCVPLPVDDVWHWPGPSPADQMLAAAGIALSAPTHMAAAFPQFWRTAEGAKTARRDRHGRSGSNSSSIIQRGVRPGPGGHLARVRYQRSGPGERQADASVDLAVLPNPRAWLEERLGQLVAFSVVAGTDAPAAAPEPFEVRAEAPDAMPDQAAGEPGADLLPATDSHQANALAVEQIKVSARPWPSLMMSLAPLALSGSHAAIAQPALGLPPARAGP